MQASVINANPKRNDGKYFVAGRGLSENAEKELSPALSTMTPANTIMSRKNCVIRNAVVKLSEGICVA